MTITMVSPSTEAVNPHRHVRISRTNLPASEIDPVLKAFGRHIARRIRKGQGVPFPR